MSVELLLIKDVADLGIQGDTVTVANGYARNYLIPQGYAEPLTAAASRRIAKLKAEREARVQAALAAAKAVAAKLKDVAVTITAKTTDGEALYGSVNAAQIVAALKEQNIDGVEETMVALEDVIKSVGAYDVVIKVCAEVSETIKVWVVAEA
ncbi:MAG: 50S ribosomal protein L9 [Kiritimatiellae bacterium]|nr:50S ribosomal protein L9 [Kiritimatiellia bacterium]